MHHGLWPLIFYAWRVAGFCLTLAGLMTLLPRISEIPWQEPFTFVIDAYDSGFRTPVRDAFEWLNIYLPPALFDQVFVLAMFYTSAAWVAYRFVGPTDRNQEMAELAEAAGFSHPTHVWKIALPIICLVWPLYLLAGPVLLLYPKRLLIWALSLLWLASVALLQMAIVGLAFGVNWLMSV